MKRWISLHTWRPTIMLFFLVALFSPDIAKCGERYFFAIQVASHKRQSNAEKEVTRLQAKGYEGFFKKTDIPGKGVWYRVYVGKFSERKKAVAYSNELKAAKITDYTMIHKFEEEIAIGVIDTPLIIRDSIAGKRAQSVYLKTLETKRDYFNSIQKKYIEKEDQFRQEENSLSKEEKDERLQKLSVEKKELLRLKTELEKELKEKDKELKTVLLKEIKEIINEFEEKEKHLILLEKKGVILIDDSVDFTDKIIKLYDASQK